MVKPMSKCPWTNNTDCICRCGSYCGGFDWDTIRPELGQCKFYQPLRNSEINRIETKIMNECRCCPKFKTNACKESGCKLMITLCYLEELKHLVKPHKKGSHITTISGVTYTGKETE